MRTGVKILTPIIGLLLSVCLTHPAAAQDDFQRLLHKAEQADAVAQYKIGMDFETGKGLPRGYKKNDEQAAIWYAKAAEQGNALAQGELGVFYYLGKGVQQDYKQAAVWIKKAAEQGNAQAQYALGLHYVYGRGVAQDYKQAK